MVGTCGISGIRRHGSVTISRIKVIDDDAYIYRVKRTINYINSNHRIGGDDDTINVSQ